MYLILRYYDLNELNALGIFYIIKIFICGPGSSNDKACGYGLDGPVRSRVSEGVEIFLRSLMSRLVLGSTQPFIT